MKNYLKFYLKRNIPYFVIFTVVILVSFLIVVINSKAYIHSYREGIYSYNYSLNFRIIFIPYVALTIITPFVANQYRYSKQHVDVVNQSGMGEKKVRYINNMSLLIMTTIIYTILFFILLLVIYLKQTGELSLTNEHYIYFVYHLGYYLLAYLLVLVIGVFNYFISYYLITRTNNILNAVILLIMGQLIMVGLLYIPLYQARYIATNFNARGAIGNWLFATCSMSPFSILMSVGYLFTPLIEANIASKPIVFKSGLPMVMIILGASLFFLFAVYSIYKFIKEDELSAEYLSSFVPRKAESIIFHLFFFLFAYLLGISFNTTGAIAISYYVTRTILLFIMFVAIYYLIYSIYRRNFHINKSDLKILIPISSVYIISFIIDLVVLITSHTIFH